MEREEELCQGTLLERLESKNWKVRVFALEDFEKELKKKVSPVLEHVRQFSKFVGDKTPPVQERALDAFITFLQCGSSSQLERYAPSVCAKIVECTFNQRVKNKEKGIEALHVYVEVEAPLGSLVEALVEGTTHKQAKVSATCVSTFWSIINSFGARVLPLKEIVRILPGLFDRKDSSIRFLFPFIFTPIFLESTSFFLEKKSHFNFSIHRSAAHDLAVELYRWIGPAFMSQLGDLRSAQAKELDTALESIKNKEKPAPSRFLRSKLREMETQGDEDESQDSQDSQAGNEEEEEVDPYEFIEEVDILEKLDESFWDGLEAKKWSDRRDALDILLGLLTQHPKLLLKADYSGIYSALRKVVEKDLNVMCVTKAVDCIGKLATGLRKGFSKECKHFVPALLEKSKDKTKVFSFFNPFFFFSFPKISIS